MKFRCCHVISLLIVAVLTSGSVRGAPPHIDLFHLRTPGDKGPINQASDLCWGTIGQRTGMWTCCDRNGLETAGKIYFFSPRTLHAATSDKMIADDAFTVTPPAGAWENFAQSQSPIEPERLEDIHKRIETDANTPTEASLDLEAITISPSLANPHEPHLFVVSEEPFSTILELSLEGGGADGKAVIVNLYAYHEKPEDQGIDKNDGLEGLAWTGKGNNFYFAEEGTRDVEGKPRAWLMFLDPRLGEGELRDHQIVPQADISEALTKAARHERHGKSQTLNGLYRRADGTLLALDRNGGLILQVNPETKQIKPWLNLYDMQGEDLRKVLAEFPHARHMPYVSIEGLALDDTGDLWLVDDPAMPEGFRDSAMMRIKAADLPKQVQSAPATSGG